MEFVALLFVITNILGSDGFIIPQLHHAPLVGQPFLHPLFSNIPTSFNSLPGNNFHEHLIKDVLGVHPFLGSLVSPLLQRSYSSHEAGDAVSHSSGVDDSCSSCGTDSMDESSANEHHNTNKGLISNVLKPVTTLLHGLLGKGAHDEMAAHDEMPAPDDGMRTDSGEMESEMDTGMEMEMEIPYSSSSESDEISSSSSSESGEDNSDSVSGGTASLLDIDASIINSRKSSNIKNNHLNELTDLRKSRKKRHYKEESISNDKINNFRDDMNLYKKVYQNGELNRVKDGKEKYISSDNYRLKNQMEVKNMENSIFENKNRNTPIALKQFFFRPHFNRIPHAVAESNLYGSYALAQSGFRPFGSDEEEGEGGYEEEGGGGVEGRKGRRGGRN